ncbi:cell wall hydrolase [Candidatus Daviesbacteria bacterium]|nr:cell wall hydrolase [Candidatus Daviesbacteria bacterium]
MELIKEDRQKRIIKGKEEIKLSSSSGFHLIILTGRAKSEKQISESSTDDEELTIQIDDKIFLKLGSDSKKVLDSPASINGGKSHNLSKTVYILTNLSGKDHEIILKTDNPPDTATFESLQVYSLDSLDTLTLKPNLEAEDGDRREWITFVLDNLSLKAFKVEVKLKRRFIDSDDVKVVVNGSVQRNFHSNFRKFWYFIASLFTGEVQLATFTPDPGVGLHYIEFWADRMPTLHELVINFGGKIELPARKPTVNDPGWTGSFDDDSEEILLARLIFGEAENQSKEVKTGVGFTVFNRIKRQQKHWGLNLREVILMEDQYDGLWNIDRMDEVRDPLLGADETTKQAWFDSYKIAQELLAGSVEDPTNGATHFHSYQRLDDFPSWATEKNFKVKIGRIYFYELEK